MYIVTLAQRFKYGDDDKINFNTLLVKANSYLEAEQNVLDAIKDWTLYDYVDYKIVSTIDLDFDYSIRPYECNLWSDSVRFLGNYWAIDWIFM